MNLSNTFGFLKDAKKAHPEFSPGRLASFPEYSPAGFPPGVPALLPCAALRANRELRRGDSQLLSSSSLL